MSYEAMLNKTCTIQTKTKTQTTSGQITESFANTYTGVVTRYSPTLRPSVDRSLALDAKIYDGVFYLKVSQTVESGNRIVFESETYEVQAVATDSQGHHKEAYVNKIVL